MDISRLSQKYDVRKIEEADILQVYRLCRGNPIYYHYCPPPLTVEGIYQDMAILPPGKTAEDKFYVGFFSEEKLAAVMDLIAGYPDPKTAMIGFFMMERSLQGKGEGSRVIADVCDQLKQAGFARVKLGYAKGNQQSEQFWLKNGFIKNSRETQAEGYIIVGMERKL